ncbi:SDR family NAD(P)-dependent oxidoreductase [Exilibacterium tricleocarpae]|uniref:SDR family NAD(P)-dependent oxidoreductase n=1 Tax=Exilibacterium tricleocarpae TaxID=2591008 RepID=A0A545U571_9GAMM|nr:SDR family NAD(P)-dependent oxidoreductase [Exilibacterium tricleocarpae]TQV84616.1 SDR family NAD(P)-dependent oxidoreductase [Exilibacterium tricleocarpae]
MELQNKVAVVTGGASGLGRAACDQLAAAGVKVAIFDLNEELAQEAVQALGPDKVRYQRVDVSDEQSVATAIADTVDVFGAIHLCVNCAGIGSAGKVLNRDNEPLPLAAFEKTLAVNLTGTFNVARLAAAQMAKNPPQGEAGERGVIINTASIAAYEGQMGQCAYAASKGGIVGLTLPMARDLATLGIRVNTIAPGIMGTPLMRAAPQQVQDNLVAAIQFPKRMGLPAEFGSLVVHIASNTYLNGETLRLDGGIRMQAR